MTNVAVVPGLVALQARECRVGGCSPDGCSPGEGGSSSENVGRSSQRTRGKQTKLSHGDRIARRHPKSSRRRKQGGEGVGGRRSPGWLQTGRLSRPTAIWATLSCSAQSLFV